MGDGEMEPRGTLPACAAAALLGFLLAAYAGHHAVLPIGSALALGVAGHLVLGGARRALLALFAVQGGYLVWLIAGLVSVPTLLVVPDILILAGLLAWVTVFVSKRAAGALIVVQALMLAFTLWQLVDNPVGSDLHRALAVHALFRIFVIILARHAFWPVPLLPAAATVGGAKH